MRLCVSYRQPAARIAAVGRCRAPRWMRGTFAVQVNVAGRSASGGAGTPLSPAAWWAAAGNRHRFQCICSVFGGRASVPSWRVLHLHCCWLYLGSHSGCPICKGHTGLGSGCNIRTGSVVMVSSMSSWAACATQGRGLAIRHWLGNFSTAMTPGRSGPCRNTHRGHSVAVLAYHHVSRWVAGQSCIRGVRLGLAVQIKRFITSSHSENPLHRAAQLE